MWAEFRKFVLRGNVLDLAVAVVIGAAFGRIVTSFVDDILMPPIGLLLGRSDFSNLFINLTPDKGSFDSVEAAKAAGAATLNYGLFINTIIQFLIVAFAVFLVVRVVSRLMAPPPPAPATAATKECPHCAMMIPARAARCPECTSPLESAPAGASVPSGG
jgi:large conductance mechanosensitive channel